MDDNKYEAISKKIRITRVALGYSQEYMAQELNISQNVYSINERNMKDVPLERVMRICNVLNLPIEELLKG
ncbi:helix-turn-helix domain-containing protein [Pedobacter jeongneungensis]|uniref:helix-turn-helix domain-containing protein n=1 Tax=Pedobacter jeongneungensis TaxID=947309 RepID=UPI0004691A08